MLAPALIGTMLSLRLKDVELPGGNSFSTVRVRNNFLSINDIPKHFL